LENELVLGPYGVATPNDPEVRKILRPQVIPQAALKVTTDLNWDGIPEGEARKNYLFDGEPEALVAIVRHAARGRPRSMVEFGCQNGRTARLILNNVPMDRYLGIDVPPNSKLTMEWQEREIPTIAGEYAFPRSEFKLLLAGNGTKNLTASDIGQFDVVFIDGDHSYEGVEADTRLAFDVVRPGGLVIWHDFHGDPAVHVVEYLTNASQVPHFFRNPIINVENTALVYTWV
jgi:predicted O-methyltransferase YrrM